MTPAESAIKRLRDAGVTDTVFVSERTSDYPYAGNGHEWMIAIVRDDGVKIHVHGEECIMEATEAAIKQWKEVRK